MEEKEIQANIRLSLQPNELTEHTFTKVVRFSEDAETNNLVLELSDENGNFLNITFNKKNK